MLTAQAILTIIIKSPFCYKPVAIQTYLQTDKAQLISIVNKIYGSKENTKCRVSSYFKVAFLLFIAPTGSSNPVGHSLTLTLHNLK